MPRAGLNTAEVVAAAAQFADESGVAALTLAALADRLGVKPPALYKHVDGIADLQHRVATLAMTELGDELRDALQGRSGQDALTALFQTLQSYIARHPGRYSATTGAVFRRDGDDPLLAAGNRLMASVRAALTAYRLGPDEIDHAIRVVRCTVHGYALLQAADGFQWGNDPAETVTWMIRFFDAGLTALGGGTRSPT